MAWILQETICAAGTFPIPDARTIILEKCHTVTLPVGKERFTQMRPPLKNFGGHPEVHQYRAWFRGIYCDPAHPIYDVKRRLVLFDQDPKLDDTVHVCYGKNYANMSDRWDEQRAERIGWIEVTLKDPTKIVESDRGLNRQVYLRRFDPDPGTEQSLEFFCVIAHVINTSSVEFVTAYYISARTYDEMVRAGKQIYPTVAPHSHKKKKRKN